MLNFQVGKLYKLRSGAIVKLTNATSLLVGTIEIQADGKIPEHRGQHELTWCKNGSYYVGVRECDVDIIEEF